MRFPLVLHPDIGEDIQDSYSYYEAKLSGLGDEFVKAVDDAFELIQQYPKMFPFIDWGVRKMVMKRFPFIIAYLFEDNRILILNVLHTSRNPDTIASRLAPL